MGKNHKRRGISKKSFVQLRGVIVEVLSNLCHLDDEGIEAYSSLFDTVYHIIFNNLDDRKMF